MSGWKCWDPMVNGSLGCFTYWKTGYIRVITHLLSIYPKFLGHPCANSVFNHALIAGWFSVSIIVPSWRYPIPFAASWQQRWQKASYIYLHEWLMFMVNVGEYTIHGFYGNEDVFVDRSCKSSINIKIISTFCSLIPISCFHILE